MTTKKKFKRIDEKKKALNLYENPDLFLSMTIYG